MSCNFRRRSMRSISFMARHPITNWIYRHRTTALPHSVYIPQPWSGGYQCLPQSGSKALGLALPMRWLADEVTNLHPWHQTERCPKRQRVQLGMPQALAIIASR
jgi:hypothetical protein